jgi:thioredoxin
MKGKFLTLSVLIALFVFASSTSCNNSTKGKSGSEIEHLTSASFKEKVFDYAAGSSWKYKGTEPCIIDFYASWCGPCKRIAPVLEDLSKEYKGKLKIYKVNVDEEKELAMSFGIQSIPTIFFCPVNDKPRVEYGALSRQDLTDIINSTLLNANSKANI